MKIKISTWGLLIFPPLFFLVSFIVLLVLIGNKNLTEIEMSQSITDSIPYILFCTQIFMLLLLLIYSRQQNIRIILDTFQSSNKVKDIVLGIALGTIIALSYFKLGILELITSLQMNIGDYVPAGETNTSVSSNVLLFFIANVVLAPFVEENIYRNIIFKNLLNKYSGLTTIILTSLFFGLLHWMGGIWYILVTAILIGIPFGIIRLKRKSILLVFSAHFSLNLIEFILS